MRKNFKKCLFFLLICSIFAGCLNNQQSPLHERDAAKRAKQKNRETRAQFGAKLDPIGK